MTCCMVICSGEIHFHWSSLQQTQHQVINFGFIQNTKYYTHEFHIYFLVVDIYIYICQCFFHHCWRFMDLAWLSKTVFRSTLSIKFTTIILSICFPWIISHVSPFPSSENWNVIHLLTLSINWLINQFLRPKD